MTDIPATVELQILIGMDGRARKIEYGTANPRLRIVLGRYFKGKARYIPACAGKTIGFTVRYIVEGNKTQFPVSEVRFRPPKEFLVVCHPIEPSLDPFPKVPPK